MIAEHHSLNGSHRLKTSNTLGILDCAEEKERRCEMSVYREEHTLTKDDKFTFEDSQILNKLRESDRLTEREKLAVQRLYRTYQYMVD